MKNRLPHSSRQQGISLLEVLISIVVLAVGMLGVASMLLVANKANNSSYAKNQAVQAVYTIFDKIRANPQAAANGSYNISNIGSGGTPTAVTAPASQCSGAPCTAAQLAAFDTWYWLTHDVAQLPSGSGSISTALSGVAGNTIVTVTVQWNDNPAQSVVGASSDTAASSADYVQLRIQSQI